MNAVTFLNDLGGAVAAGTAVGIVCRLFLEAVRAFGSRRL